MTEYFGIYLNISVTSAVMICCVALIRQILAKRLRPSTMLLLWALVLVRLLMPFTIESPYSIGNVLPEQPAPIASSVTTNTSAVQNQQPAAPADEVSDGSSPATDTNSNSINTSQLANNTAPKLSINAIAQTALPWLWIAGAIVVLTWHIIAALCYRHSLAACNAITDGTLFRRVTYWWEQVGINRKISILECNACPAPSVIGWHKPILLIPIRFINMPGASLDAIILHELQHIRNNDILMGYVWLIAKALHWFNPFVWVAYRLYCHDVELARDEGAAEAFGGGRGEYGSSLVQAARLVSGKPPHIMTATLFADGSGLKSRVLALIQPRRSRKKTAVVSVLLALVITVGFMTTACQPTPKEKAVINKNDGEMQSKISADNTNHEPYNVPAEWKEETITELDGKFKLDIDANIIMPDVDNYPVYLVEPNVDWTQEQVDGIFKAFYGDKQLYTQRPESKAEIEDWLVIFRKELSEMQADSGEYWERYQTFDEEGNRYPITEEEKQGRIDFAKENIADYEKKLLTAEENPVGKPLDKVDLSKPDTLQGTSATDKKSNEPSNYSISIGESNMMSLRNPDGFYYSQGLASNNPSLPVKGLQATDENQAIENGKMFIKEIGLEGYEVRHVSIIRQHTGSEGSPQEGNPYAFAIEFSKELGGHTFGAIAGWPDPDGQADYAYYSRGETLVLYVNDDGYVSFEWNEPYRIAETLNENIELLPFKELQRVAKQHLQNNYLYAAQATEGEDPSKHVLVEFAIEVKEFRLEYVMIPNKDDLTYSLLTPVWNVYGYTHREARDFVDGEWLESGMGKMTEEEKQREKEYATQNPLITINAIDGSMVYTY